MEDQVQENVSHETISDEQPVKGGVVGQIASNKNKGVVRIS